MNIQAYLRRIQVLEQPESSLSFLNKLQFHHVTQVPFENLDILRNIPLSLQISTMFEKLVTNNRGGVCYELNGLFHALLCELEYDAHLVAGTIYRGDHWGEENTHATILVQVGEEQYLADVGFGGNSPRQPIPLTGKIVDDIDGHYRVRAYSAMKDSYVLEKKEKDDWVMLYRFSTAVWTLEDFTPTFQFIQTSPDSSFNKGYFLMKVTEQGRMTLFDHSLTIVNRFNKTKELIEPNRIDNVVEQFFSGTDETVHGG